MCMLRLLCLVLTRCCCSHQVESAGNTKLESNTTKSPSGLDGTDSIKSLEARPSHRNHRSLCRRPSCVRAAAALMPLLPLIAVHSHRLSDRLVP